MMDVKKRKKGLAVAMCFVLIVFVCIGICCVYKMFHRGIVGTAYRSFEGRTLEYRFLHDGTFELEEDGYTLSQGTYQLKDDSLYMNLDDDEMTYTLETSYDGYWLKSPYDSRSELKYYWNEKKAIRNWEKYKSWEKFYKSRADKDGYVVMDGVLQVYVGDESDVVVPSYVTELGTDCFAGDLNYGTKIEKVTVSGNVKKVNFGAFAFTDANVVIFEEGVEELEGGVFDNGYVEEVYFPNSIRDIGGNLFTGEEDIKPNVYVKRDSYAEKYFNENSDEYNDLIVITDSDN